MKTQTTKKLFAFIIIVMMFSLETANAQFLHKRIREGLNRDRDLSINNNPSSEIIKEALVNKNNPFILQQKTIGGSGDDLFGNIITVENGYFLCGITNSTDGDFNLDANRGVDAYIAKFNNSGNLLWKKTFGGSGDEGFEYIIKTSDGGFLAAGWTTSNDGDVSGNHGGEEDIWVVKLNSQAKIQWQKCYGGSGDEYATNIAKTPLGYAFAAFSNSTDGQVSNNHGDYDAWVVRLSLSGNIIWQNSYGGSDYEHTSGFATNNDGTLILGISTFSNDGDIGTGNRGGQDGWIAKLGIGGNIIWKRRLGGSGEEFQNSLIKTSDGNIVIPFGTNSLDGDITNNLGGYDIWLVKINNNNGNIIWQKNYGDTKEQAAFKVFETSNGDLVTNGIIGAVDDSASWDIETVRVNKNGNFIWDNVIGGSDEDSGSGGAELDNGKLILVCSTKSTDGDVQNNHGRVDIWLVTISNNDNNFSNQVTINDQIVNNNEILFSNYFNTFSETTTISFTLPQSEKVSIKIYDLNGLLIKSLTDSTFEGRQHQLDWNADKAGIYVMQIQSAEYSKTVKFVVRK